jgi:hypothetical protein
MILAEVEWNAVIGVGAALGAGVAAYLAGTGAKREAQAAKKNAGEATVAATEAKDASVDTRSAVADAQASVLSAVQNFDPASSAGLFNQVSILLERATTQLVRCENENLQLQALVKVLERRVEANERELVSLRAALTAIEHAPPAAARRTTRK